MLHFLATALLGTMVLAQQPVDTVSSSDLPGSVAVRAPEVKPAPAPAPQATAQAAPEVETAPPPPPKETAPAPALEERPSQRSEPRPSSGKRVAAFWMMLPD